MNNMPNRNITTEMWNDPKIVDDFEALDIYLFQYLLTSPHTYLCGIMKCSLRTISLECKLELDEIRNRIDRLENLHKVIKYSPTENELLILNWHKYNWTKSEKLQASVIKSMANIKTQEYVKYVNEMLKQYKTNKG